MSQVSSEEYIALLQQYGIQINMLISKAKILIASIQQSADTKTIGYKVSSWEKSQIDKGKTVTEKRRLGYENYATAYNVLSQASSDTQIYKDIQDLEKLIKNGYEIIHNLRNFVTKQNTTFTVLVNIGGSGQNRILKEVHLPLEEILSISELQANFHASANFITSLKLRLHATKEQQIAWTEKFKTVDVTEAYNKFEEAERELMSNITGRGRQYEFFRKGTSDYYLKNSTMAELAQVAKDTRSFVKDVDLVSQNLETGEFSFESLKSFLGGDPSLAGLSTIISTLTQIESVINSIGTTKLKLITEAQLQGTEINKAEINKLIEKETLTQLQEIFPFSIT